MDVKYRLVIFRLHRDELGESAIYSITSVILEYKARVVGNVSIAIYGL